MRNDGQAGQGANLASVKKLISVGASCEKDESFEKMKRTAFLVKLAESRLRPVKI